MKKIIFLLTLLLGITLADMVVGNAYIISAIGIKNAEGDVVYQSGNSNLQANGTYKLAPQVIIYDGSTYVGAATPFTGCIGDKHYANGEPSGSCFTGGLATPEQDGLMSKEDKNKLENLNNKFLNMNYLNLNNSFHISESNNNSINWTKNNDGTLSFNGTVVHDGWNNRFLAVLYEGENVFAGKKLVGNPVQGNGNCIFHIDYVANDWTTYLHAENDVKGEIIIDESANIYIYILMKEGFTADNLVFKPMITDNLGATYDDFVSFNNSLVTGVNNGLNIVLLWENANPNNSFGGQDVKLKADEYKFYYVEFKRYAGENWSALVSELLRVGSSSQITTEYQTKIVFRGMWASRQAINFGEGGVMTQYGAAEFNNNYMIPIRIFGIS